MYLLSPKELSPETIAVAFAKTSRSPDSFRNIAAGLSEESSARFNERWVVGYGHASVAEHAVLHIAIENISRLAVECLESNRLASYTEKSTRYQKWEQDGFHIPSELDGHPLRDNYLRTIRLLFNTYAQSISPVRAVVERQTRRAEDETTESYERRIRSKYIEACRFLLPAASLANVGMTANARVLEYAISKMLSHPLEEVRAIGAEVRQVALEEVPILVKYAMPMLSLCSTLETFTQMAQEKSGKDGKLLPRSATEWCRLIDFDADGESKVLAAALFRCAKMSFAEALERVQTADEKERLRMAKALLGKLGEHETPLRELEHTSYTFELVLDQGGYAEFKRHRMMTQTPQRLTVHLGARLPRLIVQAGLESAYQAAMEQARESYEKLAEWNAEVASYVVPNGYNRRVLFTMNLREAFAFCQLRSAANAHFSLRRVAQRVAQEIQRVHPLLGGYLKLPQETWQEIEKKNL